MEQLDKAYTNSQNIFIDGDDVRVNAGQVDADFFEHRLVRPFSRNEFGAFAFKDGPFRRYYYFHHALAYCPNEGRDDCLSLGFADKILLTRSAHREDEREGREPFFNSIRHWRVEARFRF